MDKSIRDSIAQQDHRVKFRAGRDDSRTKASGQPSNPARGLLFQRVAIPARYRLGRWHRPARRIDTQQDRDQAAVDVGGRTKTVNSELS